MVRTQIQITEDQSRTLKRMALDRGVSVAHLIRQSIEHYLQSENEPSREELRQRALSAIGIASSGVSDLATEHDRYFAEAAGDYEE